MKPDAFKILSQAIEDGAFTGGEILCFGDYAASWDDDKNLIAIADAGGWWAIPVDVLRAITDRTPKRSHRLPGVSATITPTIEITTNI